MPIKAVLFDMFDTLMVIKKVDFYAPSLMRMYNYLNKNGVNVAFAEFEAAYNKARDELYAVADPKLEEPHFNARTALALKMLGCNHDPTSLLVMSASAEFCAEFTKFVYLDQDAKQLLGSLQGKYKLGIISNYALPECLYKLLKDQGLYDLFDAIVVSGEVNKRKPSPDIFFDTLKSLGVTASEAVFVGDTLAADVEGAKAAGMKAVYIKRRAEKDAGGFQPDFTIKRLAELSSLLQKL